MSEFSSDEESSQAMAIKCLTPSVAILNLRIAEPPPKLTDAHYRTPEHREWARAVVKRAGYRCEHPECTTPKRGAGRRLFADHKRELKDGGAPFDMRNGWALCGPCHALKTQQQKKIREAQQ